MKDKLLQKRAIYKTLLFEEENLILPLVIYCQFNCHYEIFLKTMKYYLSFSGYVYECLFNIFISCIKNYFFK